ncbi:ATP-binding protein [Actinoplanes subglobosus]|uniref:Sensor-like histidine kinase SenX3 n=1 Tax=Actinoplanes subglobosus TaxID=1547892 RepID=A0ABV8IJV7_9ACTN
MTYRASLARTGMFAVAYLIAVWAGRLTVMDDTNLSMVWPAAGIAVVWFTVQREAPARWADVAALAVITLVVNTATGATVSLALVFVAANLVQIAVFLHLLSRWRPMLRPEYGLHNPRDLWALLAAGVAGTVAGAAVGPTGMWLLTERHSWAATLVWLSRNTASILLVGTAGLCTAQAAAQFRARYGTPLAWWRATPRMRLFEYAALIVCSGATYVAAFAMSRGLPIAFALIALTVWAGTRFPTPFVVVHDLGGGTMAVLFTLNGHGPFAAIGDAASRACVAQLYVAIVAVVGLSLALGRDERIALMSALAAEKAELAAEREQASQRADLLRAIIDSTTDGLAVVGADRRVVLSNPAADSLFGSGSAGDLDEILDRALAGATVTETDVPIPGTGSGGGRVVSVRTAALRDPDGTRRVVLLFHDVTAERRHRDELAGFAGVVAHDLLNPVTAVEGWTETAAEVVERLPAGPERKLTLDALGRVERAAGRMRSLIGGLLAYTTARDVTISSARVGLGQMVSEVTVARLDAAIAAGMPAPRFTVGDLPAVQADPVLMRQLLDNLIGNAIKYTAPGVTPALAVTAVRDGEMVRVCVADNGIGIPAGQHDEIFGNFHRAHSTLGYAGTGLGLGICKRIVERHGGTITATDNPGGGSRFEFSVPAAEPGRQPVPDSAQLRGPLAER